MYDLPATAPLVALDHSERRRRRSARRIVMRTNTTRPALSFPKTTSASQRPTRTNSISALEITCGGFPAMMKVHYDGNIDLVEKAVYAANGLLADDQFYETIRQHGQFDMTSATSAQIADIMRSCNTLLSVVLYKPWSPFAPSLGKEDSGHPEFIYMNFRRLSRPMADIVGTIIHEAVHAADATSPVDFGHGDNSSRGKENTAPYWIGNMAIARIAGSRVVAVVDHAPHEEEGTASAAV
jgi:hypothetical protein